MFACRRDLHAVERMPLAPQVANAAASLIQRAFRKHRQGESKGPRDVVLRCSGDVAYDGA